MTGPDGHRTFQDSGIGFRSGLNISFSIRELIRRVIYRFIPVFLKDCLISMDHSRTLIGWEVFVYGSLKNLI